MPQVDWEQYAIVAVVVVALGFLMRIIIAPALKMLRPRAVNDLAALVKVTEANNAALERHIADTKIHRKEIRVELDRGRDVAAKLFDRTEDLGQRVSKIEGKMGDD